MDNYQKGYPLNVKKKLMEGVTKIIQESESSFDSFTIEVVQNLWQLSLASISEVKV